MISNSISNIFKSEWFVWLPIAVVAFFGASLFMSGWPIGLLPELSTPYSYSGDGMAYLWNVQRVIEDVWYFKNDRSGFPFGSNHLDYPTSDTGSYLVLKLLGLAFGTSAATFNIYYLLGFSICAIVAYLVSRAINISKHFSVVVALIYAFNSFHFGRLGHLFFTWYFVAPLFFYISFRLISSHFIFFNKKINFQLTLLNVLALFVLSSFGIYYSLFGSMVVILSTIIAAVLHRSVKYIFEGMSILGFIVLGVLLNILPSLLFIFQNGENREGVHRLASESELYALKITQLLLPRGDHRLDSFFELARQYNSSYPLVTENVSASLGVIGSLGFLILVGVILVSPFIFNKADRTPSVTQSSINLKFNVLAAVSLGLVLFGTLGGFSSLFAMLVSSSIRSWNRISIFLAFSSVLAFILILDVIIIKYIKLKNQKIIGIFISIPLLIFGILDQTAKPCISCRSFNKQLVENDRTFIKNIEASLPQHSAIYQLPYMAYSDNGQVNNLGSYDQTRGHIHSKDLKWSFGGVRAREGDWFYRKLSKLPINEQVAVVSAMGFAGIYVDRRGYVKTESAENKKCGTLTLLQIDKLKANCLTSAELELEILKTAQVNNNQSKIESKDRQLFFVPIKNTSQDVKSLAATKTYLLPIGFELRNGIPFQIANGFEMPIDFRKDDPDLPYYFGNVTGLSGISINGTERVGRWSDALVAKKVTVWLAKPLPKKFSLLVTAQAAGLNVGKPMQVIVGNQTKDVMFDAIFETKSIDFDMVDNIYKIEFKPADPFSPARRWGYGDNNLIAIQFQKIQIVPK